MDSHPGADLVAQAAAELGPHDTAVVLGSGWVDAADALGEPTLTWALSGLPGFCAPVVEGQGGSARSVVGHGSGRTLVLLGRTHLYEDRGIDSVTHAIRVAAATGCRHLILTNAAGAIDPDYDVGQPVLIRDHLNLTGVSPLTGTQFVDLTDCWSPGLRAVAQTVEPTLAEGVYAGMAGPQYETPAEIRMLRTLGADLVGMSTVLEAIVARSLGMQVLGISLVTNAAAGVTAEPVGHDDVVSAGAQAAGRLGALLAGILDEL